MSESYGDTEAVNEINNDKSKDYGLFQVSPKHSVPLCKGNFKDESNSQDVKSSLSCVVLYETLDTDLSQVQRSLPYSGKRYRIISIISYNGTSEYTKKELLLILYSQFLLYRP
jgi:hypothetical protein